jgi:hypothetical protein
MDHQPVFSAARRRRLQLTGMAALLLCLVLAGCSSPPSKPAVPEVKTPDLLTGRPAFQKCFITARGWARDAEPYRLESLPTTEGNGQDGKSAIWRASFASPSTRGTKPYFWSGSLTPDAPSRGVSFGPEDSYTPTNSSTQVFDVAFLKVDSDQAFSVAQKHGGEKITGANPAAVVTYICDFDHINSKLIWHVIYGANRETAKLTVAVDASTAEFIRVEK